MLVVTMKEYAKQNAACCEIKGTAVSPFDKEVDEALEKGKHDAKKCNHPTKDEEACVCKRVSMRAREYTLAAQ